MWLQTVSPCQCPFSTMEPPGHVQTIPSASSTKPSPFDQELDSASQPKNLQKVEDIEANASFRLPALTTVSQADLMAAPDIDSSSLTSQTHSAKAFTVAS